MTNTISRDDLNYDYPESLVALQPQQPPRVMWSQLDGESNPGEISFEELLGRIPSGDVVVLNDTQVIRRRIFADHLEILFLSATADRQQWDVLFPAKNMKIGQTVLLPEQIEMTLIEKGRPQKVKVSKPLDESYFEKCAELPLPPYIQKARGQRHNTTNDSLWYQTAWAQKPGSLAAPTASLHFSSADIEKLRKRGVQIETLTLHVGLGTFLPLTDESFEKKELHEEWIEITTSTFERIQKAKQEGRKIWALGTTVTRSLEACALGHLQVQGDKYLGTTRLFIQPGFEYQIVDRLMTNFHQPGSSLLALVMAFAGRDLVKYNYSWAIQKQFRLFSYGDFSVWIK